MASPRPLPYLPTMFATCMLFQVTYVLCVVLWAIFPELKGLTLLTAVIPQFKLLDVPNFLSGLVASAVYGWFVSIVFVYFYNLWPTFSGLVSGRKNTSANIHQ